MNSIVIMEIDYTALSFGTVGVTALAYIAVPSFRNATNKVFRRFFPRVEAPPVVPESVGEALDTEGSLVDGGLIPVSAGVIKTPMFGPGHMRTNTVDVTRSSESVDDTSLFLNIATADHPGVSPAFE